MPNQREADKFLNKVDEVANKVKDIIDGKYEMTELDKMEYEESKRDKALKKIQERERT